MTREEFIEKIVDGEQKLIFLEGCLKRAAKFQGEASNDFSSVQGILNQVDGMELNTFMLFYRSVRFDEIVPGLMSPISTIEKIIISKKD